MPARGRSCGGERCDCRPRHWRARPGRWLESVDARGRLPARRAMAGMDSGNAGQVIFPLGVASQRSRSPGARPSAASVHAEGHNSDTHPWTCSPLSWCPCPAGAGNPMGESAVTCQNVTNGIQPIACQDIDPGGLFQPSPAGSAATRDSTDDRVRRVNQIEDRVPRQASAAGLMSSAGRLVKRTVRPSRNTGSTSGLWALRPSVNSR